MARRPPPSSKTPKQRRSRRRSTPRKSPEPNSVRGLTHQLARMALELAAHLQRTEARKLTPEEIDSLLEGDETPGSNPEPATSSELLAQALGELPGRQRVILIAVLQAEAPRRTIARRMGIGVRTLDAERVAPSSTRCAMWSGCAARIPKVDLRDLARTACLPSRWHRRD